MTRRACLKSNLILSSRALDPRKLGASRIYVLSTIQRAAHFIPSDENNSRMYVNNWIDLEFYNTMFEEDWDIKRIRQADEMARSL